MPFLFSLLPPLACSLSVAQLTLLLFNKCGEEAYALGQDWAYLLVGHSSGQASLLPSFCPWHHDSQITQTEHLKINSYTPCPPSLPLHPFILQVLALLALRCL